MDSDLHELKQVSTHTCQQPFQTETYLCCWLPPALASISILMLSVNIYRVTKVSASHEH